jgi:hypothetical protein
MQGLGDGRDESSNIGPSADAPGREKRHAFNGATRMSEERERDQRDVIQAARKWGVTRPPLSSPRMVSPQPRGMGSLLAGPRSANNGQNASDRRAGHLPAYPGNLLLHGGLLTVRGRGSLRMLR